MRKIEDLYMVTTCYDVGNTIRTSFIEGIDTKEQCIKYYKQHCDKNNEYEAKRIFKLEDISSEIDNEIKENPLFKMYDIIQHKTENCFLIVMDACIKDHTYYVDDYDGETFVRKFEYIHDNYKKIGEVTYDVLKKANPNLKDKNEID